MKITNYLILIYLTFCSYLSFSQSSDSLKLVSSSQKTTWHLSIGYGRHILNEKLSINSAVSFFHKSGFGYSIEMSNYYPSEAVVLILDTRKLNTFSFNIIQTFRSSNKIFKSGASVGVSVIEFYGQDSSYEFANKYNMGLNLRLKTEVLLSKIVGIEAGLTGNINQKLPVLNFEIRLLFGRLK